MFVTALETTQRVRAKARDHFLVELNEALRPLDEPEAITATAARLLGEHLAADRCAYAEVEADEDHFVITGDYVRGDMVHIVGRFSMSAFGAEALRLMRENQPFVVDDADTDARVTAADRAAYQQTAIQAMICVPLHKAGRFVAGLAVHQRRPRHWTPEEIELVTTVTNRCWEAMERARLTRELRESEARMRRALEIETVGIIFFDPAGDITRANDAFLRMGGYTQEDVAARRLRWDKLTPPEWMPASRRAIEQLKTTGSTVPYEKQYYRKDGSRWWGLFAAKGLSETEGVEFILDITERKRAEEARRKRELEGALEAQLDGERRRLARELHDGLRQELVGIQMLASSLTRKLEARAAPEAGLMKTFSELIGDANRQVRELIDGLVPVKIEADSLLPALERAAANLEQWYGLNCRVICPQPLPLPDDETANHLFHIAREAMTNAAKHAKASQIDVCLEVAGETLTLEVHDDGIGLPEHFDKRGGMGFSNLRTRAELLDAHLNFRSDPDSGTVVTCRLSLA